MDLPQDEPIEPTDGDSTEKRELRAKRFESTPIIPVSDPPPKKRYSEAHQDDRSYKRHRGEEQGFPQRDQKRRYSEPSRYESDRYYDRDSGRDYKRPRNEDVPDSVRSFHHSVVRTGHSRSMVVPTPHTAQRQGFQWPDNKFNPHLEFAYEKHIFEGTFGFNNRILTDDCPRREYRRRKADGKSSLHWGQRKLLFSEIEFLIHYGHEAKLVVYAGAAPGSHITILSEMFPDHTFHLWDPNAFDKILSKPPYAKKITCFQNYFLEKDAASYNGQNVLFISDIRTANPSQMDDNEVRERVESDNQWMKDWCKAMKPTHALLKWKLPYQAGKTNFLTAERIYLPIWGPVTTTECRFVPHPDLTDETFDHTDYEQQLFYFNTVTRLMYYPHKIQADGIDHCFDCRSEIFVLDQFLDLKEKRRKDALKEDEVADEPELTPGQKASDRRKAIASLSEYRVKDDS